MRDLYARFVLWLIRPALALHEERQRVSPEDLAAELGRLDFKLSPDLVSLIHGGPTFRVMAAVRNDDSSRPPINASQESA